MPDIEAQNPGGKGWDSALAQMCLEVRELHDQGVGVMAGTDTGATMIYPGSALHQELKLLVKNCHLTPMDALLSASIIPAKFFNMEAQLGTIEAGKIADLVLLSKNPLLDIANIRLIDGVVLNGRWLDRAALDRLTKAAEKQMALDYAAQTQATPDAP